jgi:NADPH:quinone reductase-like Zn-dependent oxidoreductase
MSFVLGVRKAFAPSQRAVLALRKLSTMKAVVLRGDVAHLDNEHRVPQLRDDCVLVRPVAVALNPTDWRHIRNRRARDGCILGCDYAGVVEAVGSAVTRRWQPGDRIFGCGHGANFVNPDDGVFAEVAAVVGDLQMRIPDSLSFEEAATLGLGAITVGQGLYQKALKLELPSSVTTTTKDEVPVLIYGGGTSTGALAIQFAKL